jgi:GTP cyclohydrolase II
MVHKAERGLFELRQGRALHVTAPQPGGSVLVAAVEGLGNERLDELRALDRGLRLVVTHHRGQAMGLTNGGAQRHLSLKLDPAITPAAIQRLATAMGDKLGTRAAGALGARPASSGENAALGLARLGQLIPAVVSVSVDSLESPTLDRWLQDGVVLDVESEEVERMLAKSGVEVVHVTEAPVPLEGAENARFVFFREGNSFVQHVAVLIGEQANWPDPVPVRIHSSCLTGDIFGSLRCDCGEQLQGSIRHFMAQGGGVLVYLAQEGRAIGLGNKLRAYALQQEGLDTLDADGALGFGHDERDYDAGIGILKHLGIERVELLTNNPDKVRAVEDSGIRVVHRKPLHGRLTRHNLPYVHAKVHRSGHWLMDMISKSIAGD